MKSFTSFSSSQRTSISPTALKPTPVVAAAPSALPSASPAASPPSAQAFRR
eukprot:CAMPEP_0197521810 /NCGR_PEP_ID=MMETSP1318-20131121/7032_1 /TAXON_ID=552666 /ORGANISM="Partenskyella glossopodia, Strain RCC365" /LENGTH=50 /DNA_ID=CAMNT_0043073939 /DNA_START=458 /DNA_END=606 /DNA_ORIENTATION=-